MARRINRRNPQEPTRLAMGTLGGGQLVLCAAVEAAVFQAHTAIAV